MPPPSKTMTSGSSSSSNDNTPSLNLEIVGLPSPLERDHRKIPQATTPEFVGLLAFLPLWIALVLPLTVVYQLLSRIVRLFVKRPRPSLDAGTTAQAAAAPTTILPRADRKYDIVVLGVTGFTGRLAARHLAKQYGANDDAKKANVKWAMAGRSLSKLRAVQQALADELQLPGLIKNVDLIVVDTTDPTTMPALVKDTRCVATTAGPYQEYGTAVLAFCALYGTHYTDITGEVGWVKQMMVKWGDVAKKTGAKIVPFCGHDSIPWDLTVLKLNQLLADKCQDDLKTVKVWDEFIEDAPGGTYATALLNLEGNGTNSPRCQIDPFLQLHDGSKSTHSTREELPFWIEPFVDGRWTSPFIMAVVNAKIIRWTQALRQQGDTKVSYREVVVHADFKTAFCAHVGLMVVGSLLLNPLTKWLAHLVFLPRPGQGPTLETMETTNYLLITAEGLGVKGNRAETTFYFPQDPGCLETAKMMVESGLAMALSETTEKQKPLPSGTQGGFWSPAAGLGDVLLDRLVKVGAEFNSRVVAKVEEKDKKA